jgi:hypothetical protein
MRFPLAISAAALIGVAIAACSGGQSSNYIAPPPAATATSGPVALNQSSSAQSLAGSNNVTTAVVTYGAGSGTIAGTSSGTAPAGTTAVTPAGRIRLQAISATSPNVFYVTLTSTTGATLSGLPQVSLALSAAAVGTFQEAQYTSGAWSNVSGSSATLNSAGTSVVFAMGTTPITIPANGSIYLAFYQGNYPNPTPTPLAPPTNIIADTNFASGSAGAYGTAIGTKGWTQCTITGTAPGATPPTRVLTTFTPTPGSTPGASLAAVGTAVTVGSAAPNPKQSSVPATTTGTGSGFAAQFGGVFSNYNQEDLRYNGLCQQITVPLNPTMTFNVFGNGNDGATYDDFEIDVLNTTGQFLGNLYEDKNPTTSTVAGDTAASGYRAGSVSTTTLAPYVGQTVELFVGLWVDAGSGSNSQSYSEYYWLENVSLVGNP